MLRLDQIKRARIGSAAAVAAVHALILYALLRGLGFELPAPEPAEVKLINLAEEPPPPPADPAKPEKVKQSTQAKPKDPEGAAAPPNLKDTPTQVVAPTPKVILPVPPIIPVAPVAGEGNAPAAGAAEVPGPGTGRGGEGNGLGSGRFGTGTGGGGGGLGRGARAQHISGGIGTRDYPRRAIESRASGTVYLRFTVTPQGRVRDCAVTRSSGSGDLDRVTCALIERRFRYRPARDAVGRPVAETIRGQHLWELGPEPPPIDIEPDIPDD
ncbi:MAG TPA: energy transducer TonB [Allosphingosinicella sp.]|nr:energy transducer TonB [Allosphingosinicella sp.]